MYDITSSSLSETGNVREMNEDAVLERSNLFAVADGMGGHQAGEVASSLALSVLEEYIEDNIGAVSGEKLVEKAVLAANSAVYHKAQESSKYRTMGTTLTAIYREGDTAYIAHVGDSRAYMMRDGTLKQLTSDHSLVAKLVEDGEITSEQALTHPQRNIILKALGLEQTIEPDVIAVEIKSGDEFLLASDGLMTEVLDADIEQALGVVAEPREQAKALADTALAAGGRDNVSVVLVRFEQSQNIVPSKTLTQRVEAPPEPAEPGAPKKRSRGLLIAIVLVAVVLILLAGALVGGVLLHNRSYFVGAKNGKVTLYRGFPFWGLADPVKVTATDVSLLPEATQTKVNGNMEVESRSEAQRTLVTLEVAARDFRQVPDVMGKTYAEARKAIQDAGLRVGKPLVVCPSAKPGTVIHQDPEAFKRVGKGTTVKIQVVIPGDRKEV